MRCATYPCVTSAAANGENEPSAIDLAVGPLISTITRMNDVAAANQVRIPQIFPDQLLVSTPYVAAVIEKLNSSTFKMRVPAKNCEASVPLGLTRIDLVDTYGHDSLGAVDGGGLNIDDVLDKLREEFGKDNAGWFPLMGKNRALADNSIGSGSMIYKGVDDPEVIKGEKLAEIRKTWDGGSWPNEPGGGVRVGIVDTRISKVAPLAEALRCSAMDMLSPTEMAKRAGHATFVAGLILSIAPGVTIRVRGILDNDGVADSWSAAKAIVEIGNQVDILNLSFGCVTGDGQPPLALATAINVISPRTVIVAAAGNFESEGPLRAKIDRNEDVDVKKCASFPAALDNVIAVGSAKEDRVTNYSPHGPWVDVYADGGTSDSGVSSTFLQAEPYNGYATWKGTSFAAAQVTGAIAAEMNSDDTSAHRAWEAVRDRFEPQVLQVPQPAEDVSADMALSVNVEPDRDMPTLITSSVIKPVQWFHAAPDPEGPPNP